MRRYAWELGFCVVNHHDFKPPASESCFRCSFAGRMKIMRKICIILLYVPMIILQTFYPQKVGTSFANKRRPLGRYSSLADYKPRSLVLCVINFGWNTTNYKLKQQGLSYNSEVYATILRSLTQMAYVKSTNTNEDIAPTQ
jgi:hypothetical protein